MRNKARPLFALALILPALGATTAFAHSGHYHTEDTEAQVAATTTENTTLASRLAERKAKSRERLTEFQLNVIKTQCKSAASKIANVRGRVTAFEAQRPGLYKSTAAKLEKLSPKLQTTGVNVTGYNQ